MYLRWKRACTWSRLACAQGSGHKSSLWEKTAGSVPATVCDTPISVSYSSCPGPPADIAGEELAGTLSPAEHGQHGGFFLPAKKRPGRMRCVGLGGVGVNGHEGPGDRAAEVASGLWQVAGLEAGAARGRSAAGGLGAIDNHAQGPALVVGHDEDDGFDEVRVELVGEPPPKNGLKASSYLPPVDIVPLARTDRTCASAVSTFPCPRPSRLG